MTESKLHFSGVYPKRIIIQFQKIGKDLHAF